MPEKMKVTEILRKEQVTCFTAVSPNGQVTHHMVCWRMPSSALIDAMKNGDIIAQTIN